MNCITEDLPCYFKSVKVKQALPKITARQIDEGTLGKS